MECPSCDGHGCEKCDGGHFSLDGSCPKEYCQPIAEAVHAYSLMTKGFLPESGGTLEQAAKFVDVMNWFANEEARFEIEQIKE